MKILEPVTVTESELSELMSLSTTFLQRDRRGKRLLPFYKLGGAVRYDLGRVRQALLSMELGGGLQKKTRASIASGLAGSAGT